MRHLPITAAKAMAMPILPAEEPNASATRSILSRPGARRQQAHQDCRRHQCQKSIEPENKDQSDDRHQAGQQNEWRGKHGVNAFSRVAQGGKLRAEVREGECALADEVEYGSLNSS